MLEKFQNRCQSRCADQRKISKVQSKMANFWMEVAPKVSGFRRCVCSRGLVPSLPYILKLVVSLMVWCCNGVALLVTCPKLCLKVGAADGKEFLLVLGGEKKWAYGSRARVASFCGSTYAVRNAPVELNSASGMGAGQRQGDVGICAILLGVLTGAASVAAAHTWLLTLKKFLHRFDGGRWWFGKSNASKSLAEIWIESSADFVRKITLNPSGRRAAYALNKQKTEQRCCGAV